MKAWSRFWKETKRRLGVQEKVDKEELSMESSRMKIALQQWFRIFYNEPYWASNGKSLTKFGAIVARHVATLSVSEISVAAGIGTRADFVQQEANRFIQQNLYNGVQLAAVGGMVAIKPYLLGKQICCDVVKAGDFKPLRFEGGKIVDALFFDSAKVDGKVYIRCEKHVFLGDSVKITNRIFHENDYSKQNELTLSMVTKWADLPAEIIVENVNRPLFTIIKMPFANTIDANSKLPVSIYANAVDTLCEIDRIYNEFLWEISSGRRKQIIDITAAKIRNAEDVRNGQDPKIATSDQFLVLDFGNSALTPFADYTPEMRVTAYQTALNIQLRLLESQCGLSAETFSFDLHSGQTLTATEVVSNDRNTYNTIKAIQESGIRGALLDLMEIFSVYASLYHLAPLEKISPTVDFGDSVFEDTGVEFARRKSLADSGYIRKEDMTAWYFGISDEKAKELLPKQEVGIEQESLL